MGWGGGGGIITTGPYLTTVDGQSCFTKCMWEGGAPVISAQECEFSVPIFIRVLRSAFPHSCIKFTFPRARVPKRSGTREGNAKPGTRAHL